MQRHQMRCFILRYMLHCAMLFGASIGCHRFLGNDQALLTRGLFCTYTRTKAVAQANELTLRLPAVYPEAKACSFGLWCSLERLPSTQYSVCAGL